tara:strand:+ start:212 stop:712 length:501 start_codon:yes stop_codon:yes gene_type:complete
MKTLHRNTPARGYGHKRAIDSNGNTRLTLYYNGRAIAGSNGIGWHEPTASDSETVNRLLHYFTNYGNKAQKERLSRAGEKTLDDAITGDFELSEKDISQLVYIIGGRDKTRARVRSVLTYDCTRFKGAPWWAERLYFCRYSGRWSYCAGQDYTSELAVIRKEITTK